MKDHNGDDLQWVIYHDSAWDALVEQGYVTERVEDRDGQQMALMRWVSQQGAAPRYTA